MKTFIFAIGGTGARVLRAFTMLTAMDIDVKSEIIPIIIDMDVKNGDTARSIKTLDTYRRISETAYDQKPEAGFFRNTFGTLGKVQTTVNGATDSGVKDSFQLDFGNVNATFNEYIKGNQLQKIDSDFLESLFDNSDRSKPQTELNLELSHGFKGNPNIGSIVFNNLINTKEFRHFENVFSQGDRIFIISSIFGGTGSSGFPQLVKNIRVSNNNFIKNAAIGAVVVKPYFRVVKDGKSSIDSDTFNSKTKSALTYYAQELDGEINQLYYIADQPGEPIPNNMGGDKQKNNAHVVELLAAKAILNFVNKPDSDVGRNRFDHYEYGSKDGQTLAGIKQMKFEDFYDATETPDSALWPAFFKFALFVKFYQDGLSERKGESFYKDLNLKKELTDTSFYVALSAFAKGFRDWTEEMSRNTRAFNPLDFDGDFSKFLKGKNLKELDKSFYSDKFTGLMNDYWKTVKKEGKIKNEEKFIRMVYETMEQAYDKYVKELPKR